MNAEDVLKYGHLTVVDAVSDLDEEYWDAPGVCGWWSVKNIIAHLTSFELMLVDVLNGFVDAGPTPYLDAFAAGGQEFNDAQVAQRQDYSVGETMNEYADAHEHVTALIKQIPVETRRENGALAWYGAEYDLEDFLAYSFYGHKREHCAQIAVFRDGLASKPPGR
jgi:uncharacterized damage-inducible protein DinB